MLKQIEGSRAVAEAVAMCRPDVVCAYPISPQTHIVEALGEMTKAGHLPGCEYINVESEFAAMSVAIGASATGARAYTATTASRRAGCQVSVEFLDPDGHHLEFYWGVDQIGYDGRSRPAEEWRQTLTLEDAVRIAPVGQDTTLHDPSLSRRIAGAGPS